MVAAVERMFSVKETPWHRQGAVLGEAPTLEEARSLSLPWEVEMRPLYVADCYANGDTGYRQIQNVAACRSDTGDVLGVHGPNWTPLRNEELFELFRPWYDAGQISFETAGALYGGGVVWVLARINQDPIDIVPGDPVKSFVLAANGHNGQRTLTQGLTSIRVVCANTLAAAEGKGAMLIRTFHRRGIGAAAREIFEALDLARQQFLANAELYKALARRPINDDDFRAFVKLVFTKETYRTLEEQAAAEVAAERHIDACMPLMEEGCGMDIPGVRGTWWGAYNSVTEYLNHQMGTDKARLGSLWFGASRERNRKALRVAVDKALV